MKPTRRTFLAGLSLAPLLALFRGSAAKAELEDETGAGSVLFGARIPDDWSDAETDCVASNDGAMLFGADFPCGFADYEASIPIRLDPPDDRWGDIVRNASRAIDRRLVAEFTALDPHAEAAVTVAKKRGV